MPVGTQNNESPMRRVSYASLQELGERAMEIDRSLHIFLSESRLLLLLSGEVDADSEAALCVLKGNELRQAIWQIVDELTARCRAAERSESQTTGVPSRTSPEEDMRLNELSDALPPSFP